MEKLTLVNLAYYNGTVISKIPPLKHGEKMHRLRISDEEIKIIKKALKLLIDEIGYIRDTAEKELIWRTFERFHQLAQKDPIFKRPRRQLYHEDLVNRAQL